MKMRVFERFRSLNLPARLSKTKKIHSMDRFHGNGPYGKIPTKKEPIRTLGFTSRLSCHIIIIIIIIIIIVNRKVCGFLII